MIVTQELLDAMKEHHIVGRAWFDLGDSLTVIGTSKLGGDVCLYCEAKALYASLPIDLVEEFINVS